jgi:outer membrane protein assembly factor BamA
MRQTTILLGFWLFSFLFHPGPKPKTEKGLDFYGFNGYQSKYNAAFVDENDDANYITRMFYRHERKLFRFTTDLQGKLSGEHLRWVGGFAILSVKAAAIDTAALNKKKDDDEKLPYVKNLYDKYVDWGLLNDKEKDGGSANFFKLGVVYDTRDKEGSATKGMWSEALLVYSPSFFFNPEFSFTKLILIHRQYFTIIPKKLTVAYRLGYQGTIGGTAPFYFEPYMISSYSSATKTDGLGGAKSLRGILRNRVVGDGVAYGNLEVRWKFLQTHLGKANLDFSLNGFADAGMVVKPFEINKSKIPTAELGQYFDFSSANDKLHPAAGAGLRIALNENFILAIDYGLAFNKQDGAKGLYISIGNLF